MNKLDSIYNIFSKFFKLNIYQSLILYLIILMIVGFFQIGFLTVYLQIISALLTTIIIDLIITFIKTKKLKIPYSAIITGLFIGITLSPIANSYTPILAGLVAILGKHLIKIKGRHILNPAVSGLFISGIFFNGPSSWWGFSSLTLVVIFGALITLQLRRIHLILSYYISFIIASILIGLFINSSLINSLILVNSFLFFMFFMLTEPKTSPASIKARIIFGLIVGILNPIFFMFNIGLNLGIDSSLVSLLIANLFTPSLNKI